MPAGPWKRRSTSSGHTPSRRQANIILVEAASSSLTSLFSAVSFAGKQAGVTVVSMSWGSSEFRGESNYDSVFTTAAGHAGVTYVAASGDTGASGGPEYPSVSPNVLAVGGTTLTLTASGSYSSESGWSGSTGGFSGTDSNFRFYESEPSYQTSTLAVGRPERRRANDARRLVRRRSRFGRLGL